MLILKKISKLQYYAKKCVYYLTEYMTLRGNLKNPLLVLMGLQSNLSKHPQSAVGMLF
jgi:hypothetical protein